VTCTECGSVFYFPVNKVKDVCFLCWEKRKGWYGAPLLDSLTRGWKRRRTRKLAAVKRYYTILRKKKAAKVLSREAGGEPDEL